jgi:hypothetical protein
MMLEYLALELRSAENNMVARFGSLGRLVWCSSIKKRLPIPLALDAETPVQSRKKRKF